MDKEQTSPRIFGYLSTVMLAYGIVFIILRKIQFPVINRVIMVLMGAVYGVIGNHSQYFKDQSDSVTQNFNPRDLLDIIYPFYVLNIALGMESYTLMRCFWQVLLTSTVGYLISSVVLGFLVTAAVFNTGLDASLAIIYGLVLSQPFCYEVGEILREKVDVKHLLVLLEVEGIMVNGVCIVCFEIILGSYFGYIKEWFQVIAVLLRFILGAFVVGGLITYIAMVMIRTRLNEPVGLMIMMIFCMFISYGITEMMSIAGLISCIILGIVVGTFRASFRSRVDRFVQAFCIVPMALIQNTMSFTIGVLLVQNIKIDINFRNVLLVIVVYLMVYITRLIVIILLAPILSRIGFGLTFKECLVLVWGSTRGLYSFLFALILIHQRDTQVRYAGQHLLFVCVGVMFLSILINGSTFKIILHVFGMGEISQARKSNMTSCLKRLEYKRTRCMTTLKYDRFLSDVKWSLVAEATALKHPYKDKNSEDNGDDEYFLGNKVLTCPSCLKDVPTEPTRKEINDMIREARRRILKGQSVSFARQHESGLLSKIGFRILSNTIETGLASKEVVVVLDDLNDMLSMRNSHYFGKFVMNRSQILSKRDERQHHIKCRKICRQITNSVSFMVFIYIVILINSVLVILELAYIERRTPLWLFSMYCNIGFYMIYLMEFILKVLGLSYSSIKEGFDNYFKNFWDIFDFLILISCTVDVSVAIVLLCLQRKDDKLWILMTVLKFFRMVRILRLIEPCQKLFKRFSHFMEERADKRLMLSYEVGKAYVTSIEDVQDILQQMIENVKVRENCRVNLERDRLMITRQLGLIQKDRPWITITVKTKQAIVATLNSIKSVIKEIKVSGWVDDIEHRKLMDSLSERYKLVYSLRAVQPSTPKEMIKEIPWMSEEDELAEKFFEKVIPRTFQVGETICAEGSISPGIYLIIQGLIKLTYNPNDKIIENLDNYGALPVVDFLATTRFTEKYEEYFGSGNTIGEICVLTKRSYDCLIIAETSVQSFLITNDVLQEAFDESNDTIEGLKAKMWKTISTRLATAILVEIPNYYSQVTTSIRYVLDKSFVPDLSRFRVFSVTEAVEDLILIEGVIMDLNTKEFYVAPTYLPRTLQKLVFPTDESMKFETTIETKLLILPNKDLDEMEVMEMVEDASDINRTESFLHIIKERKKRKKRQRRTTFAVSRRPVLSGSDKRSKRTTATSIGTDSYNDSASNYTDDESYKENASAITYRRK